VQRSWLQQVEKVTPLDSDGTCPFVGEALRTLRQEVGNASTVGHLACSETLIARTHH
jgi:hypothetical protein